MENTFKKRKGGAEKLSDKERKATQAFKSRKAPSQQQQVVSGYTLPTVK